MPKVNHEILSWARETAGLTPADATGKLGIRDAYGVAAVDRLTDLETGAAEPTRPMLAKMAKQYHRPLLTFYLSAPPAKGDRGADFRIIPAETDSSAADAIVDVLLREIKARQSMVRAVMEDEEETEQLHFVGSRTIEDGPSVVLDSLQKLLDFKLDEFRRQRNPGAGFTLIRRAAENAGVFVLLKGDLGSHHTSIEAEVFRGFTISDDIAPLIVINDRDAQSAWSFTLLHEFTHLILGHTGIGGADSEHAVEFFCNDVAGEILLPSHELEGVAIPVADAPEATVRWISEFAGQRNLSRSMVVYKAWRSGSIERGAYEQLTEQFRQQWIDQRRIRREQARQQEGGPSYYVVRRHRTGNALVELVRRTMTNGTLTTSRAAQILGVKPRQVQALLNAQ